MKSNHTIVLMPRAFHNFLARVIEHGEPFTARGLQTRELLNSSLLVRDPLDRIITDRGRKMNIAFGIAEWYAIMFGINSIEFFKNFISDYDKYSSDGTVLDGAYGTRINYFDQNGDPRSQIQGVIQELRRDPTTRRAVISIYRDEDLFGLGGKNTPCTLSLQFLIREGQLHMIVNMRSSDVVRGVTYDLFVFTMLQEYIARHLEVELGSYFHNAGSLHFYETDMPLYKGLSQKRWPGKMHPMPLLESEDLRRLERLITRYLDSREFFTAIAGWPTTPSTQYLKDLAYVMKAFRDRKSSPNASHTAFSCINDPTLKYVLRPWMRKREAFTAATLGV